MSEVSEQLGDRLRRAMKAKRVSNGRLAEVAGVHTGTVTQWLGNRFPPTDDKLDAIARELDVTPQWLKYGDNNAAIVREPSAPSYGTRLEIAFESPTAAGRSRVWLEQFLLGLAEEGAADEFLQSARRVLLNPDNYDFEVDRPAGKASAMTDDEKFEHMKELAGVIRSALRRRQKSRKK